MTIPERILLTAPTGPIGRRVLELVSGAGLTFSIVVRSASLGKIPTDLVGNAPVHIGELHDSSVLIEAGVGADVLVLILPTDVSHPDLAALWRSFGAAAIASIRANNIEHVVFISSQGADAGGAALLNVFADIESDLFAAAPHVRILRPGYLMENLLMYTELLAKGILPTSTGDDTQLNMVTSDDVAAVALSYLANISWTGHEALAVYGPRSYTPLEAAATLSAALGRPIERHRSTYDEVLAEFLSFGIPPATAQAMAEMFTLTLSDPGDTGDRRRRTSLEAFARERLLPTLP
ncbi:MAG TPA: NAD(P)H-binding protein [Pseudolysinimonas sp.]|nr:NAD(P)H-binding protein [Pseudolysinimonas sp.]